MRRENEEDPLERYLDDIYRSIKLKDEKAKTHIINGLRSNLKKETTGTSYKELVSNIGRPSMLGKRFSDPRNWTIQLGTPIRPSVEIPPYFSAKGRIVLMGVLMICFIGIAALLAAGVLTDPWIIGSLIMIFVIWLVAASLLNDHLGYFTHYRQLIGQGIRIEGIDRSYLTRSIQIALMVSFSILVPISIVPFLLFPDQALLISPLSLSTLISVSIGCFLVHKEGRDLIPH